MRRSVQFVKRYRQFSYRSKLAVGAVISSSFKWSCLQNRISTFTILGGLWDIHLFGKLIFRQIAPVSEESFRMITTPHREYLKANRLRS